MLAHHHQTVLTPTSVLRIARLHHALAEAALRPTALHAVLTQLVRQLSTALFQTAQEPVAKLAHAQLTTVLIALPAALDLLVKALTAHRLSAMLPALMLPASPATALLTTAPMATALSCPARLLPNSGKSSAQLN